MFRRSLRALGGRRTRHAVLGGRSILVPPKSPYPLKPLHPQTPYRRQGAARTAAERRRRNLAYLAVFVITTFVLAWVPGLRFLLVVNLIADILLILYLAAAVFLVVWPRSERELQRPPIEQPVAGSAVEGL